MRNIERSENSFNPHMETGDKEGTYEQKKNGDLGSQTVFTSKGQVTSQKKVKTKKSENIIFTD